MFQVADDVNVAMERVCGTLEQESSRLTQTMGETIYELFMSLKILKGFREFLPLKLVKQSNERVKTPKYLFFVSPHPH